jgi:hypothetical protein
VKFTTAKLTKNLKILIGFSVQLTTAVFYIVTVGTLDHIPEALRLTFVMSFTVAATLLVVGCIEEDQKRKSAKTSAVGLTPEAH